MTRRMTILALLVVASIPALADRAVAQGQSKGLEPIFNGKDLSDWDGDPRLWSVQDGVIHGETTEEKKANGNTFLIYKGGTLKDFELRLTFRCTNTNNSGIQYRSKHITDDKVRNEWVVRGYQHEIRNENELPSVSGFIYDEGGKRGRMALVGERTVWDAEGKRSSETFMDADAYRKLFKLDDWNDVMIVANGSHIKHYLNGTLVMECTDNHPEMALREGILALQLHGGKPMWAEYKNIYLRHIP